jgi:hypothetical protein
MPLGPDDSLTRRKPWRSSAFTFKYSTSLHEAPIAVNMLNSMTGSTTHGNGVRSY